MVSYCMFREEIDAPIFSSYYDFDRGTIDGVPVDKFKVNLPRYYYERFDAPPNFGLPFDKAYYIYALQATKGLFVTNFYDVGVTVVSKSCVYIFFFEGRNVKFMRFNHDDWRVFNYNKTPIGTYKTVVAQLDISQNFCLLYVDDEGKFLTSNGVIDSGIKDIVPIDRSTALQGCVRAWRSGYDGIIHIDGVRKEYKVVGDRIEFNIDGH